MQVLFYNNFSKRKNSTKLPASSLTPITLDCRLKEETSILSPTVIISGNHFDYTYAYIPDWHRYYFVENIKSENNGLVQIELTEDILASWKTQIGSTRAGIAYSSTGWNKDITETRVPQITTKQIEVASYTPGYMSTTGTWILAAGNAFSSGGAGGFLTYYVLTGSDMGTICNLLYNLTPAAWLASELYSPLDCIVDCFWLPIDYNYVVNNYCATSGVTFQLGAWDSEIPVAKLTSSTLSAQILPTFTPRYTDYRAIEPFTSYQMFLPLYGLVSISASDIRNTLSGNMVMTFTLDLMTGNASLGVMGKGGLPFAFQQLVSYKLAVACPVSGSQVTGLSTYATTMAQLVGSAGNMIGEAFTAPVSAGVSLVNAFNSGVGTIASAVQLQMEANRHGVSTLGSQGSRALLPYGIDFLIIETTIDTENPDNANFIALYGRPCGYTDLIGNHSGYVQCDSVALDISALDDERDRLTQYMTGGFYYE